jgi:hypothetical protein
MKIIFAYHFFILLPFISSHVNILFSSGNEAVLRIGAPMIILASVWKFHVIDCNWIFRIVCVWTGGLRVEECIEAWNNIDLASCVSLVFQFLPSLSGSVITASTVSLTFHMKLYVIGFRTWHNLFCITVTKSSGIRSRDQGGRVYK